MTVSEYIWKYLAKKGIKHVFTLVGGGSMYLVDALGRNKDITPIFNLHEQASAICADGYSQCTNNFGVCLVTTGPGGTNAITGVMSAWIDSIPMLIISGQVKTDDMISKDVNVRQRGSQEVNIIPIVKNFTKHATTITNPNNIKIHLDEVLYKMNEGRKGPVWLDVPLNIQKVEIDEYKLASYDYYENYLIDHPAHKQSKIQTKIDTLLTLLSDSKQPVILAGNGIRTSGALDLFKHLIKYYLQNIPVLTTWHAVDFFDEDDSNYIGRPGSIGQRAANVCQQQSDLIIVLGARLDLNQVAYSYENFAPNAKKVIVEIDEEEIKKIACKIDLEFNYDVKYFLEELLTSLQRYACLYNQNEKDVWFNKCIAQKYAYPVYSSKEFTDNKNPYIFVQELSNTLTKDDVIVCDSSGMASEIMQQAFQIKEGQRFFCSPGLGSMGFQLPHAIGATFAFPDKRIICVAGDGSFQLNIQELELIKRYDLNIKIFYLDNKGYGSIRNTQDKFFNGNYVGSSEGSNLTFPDITAISEAYGLDWIIYDHNMDYCLNFDMIIVPLNYTNTLKHRVESKVVDGKIVSGRMEEVD